LTLFVDSSMFYAAADRGDRGNERAKAVLSGEEPLLTTDHVLVETWLLLRHRLGGEAARAFWDALRRGAAQLEQVLRPDLDVAWEIGEDFPDQDFSLVDRTSFAVMRRLGVARAATFDEDFAIYRFGPERRRAFEIVR
jgi:predicted nucleic acid-binding protein